MPQLAKGGKHVFGWSMINDDLKIRIPDEAFQEYRLFSTTKLIIFSGSRTSGGFAVSTPQSIVNSLLGENIVELAGYKKDTDSFSLPELEIVKHNERWFCWTGLHDEKYFYISKDILVSLYVEIGHKLLVIRGSSIGPAFAAKGPIYKEALNHKNIVAYR